MHHRQFFAAPLDLVPLLLRPISNQTIFALIECAGPLNAAKLQQAARHLLDVHPILACSLADDSPWPVWQSPANRPEPEVRWIASGNNGAAIHDYMTSAMPGDRGTPLEIALFRGSERDTLCITVDHTVADAAGVKEILYAFAAGYNRGNRSPHSKVNRLLPENRGLCAIKQELGWRKQLHALMSGRPRLPCWKFPVRTPPAAFSQPPGISAYLVHHLPAATLAQRQKSATPGTVNDALLAAFFWALRPLARQLPDKNLPVQFTVDLRRYFGSDQRPLVANLSSTEHVILRYQPWLNHEQLCATVHEQTRRIKDRHPGVAAALVVEFLLKLNFSRCRAAARRTFADSANTGLTTPLISNFGILDEHRLKLGSTPVRHAYLVTPSLLTPGLMVGASTFRQRLTLSAGFSPTHVTRDFVTRTLHAMSNFLLTMR